MRALVSSVRVETRGAHDVVSVWSRGGLAGSLTVNRGDGRRLADVLLPDAGDTREGSEGGEWSRRVCE